MVRVSNWYAQFLANSHKTDQFQKTEPALCGLSICTVMTLTDDDESAGQNAGEEASAVGWHSSSLVRSELSCLLDSKVITIR